MQLKLEQWCQDFDDYLSQSPIRQDDSNKQMISPDALQNLNKVTLDLVKIQQNLFTTLKVVLIGEVKAGKSTLINAMVGSHVSPTDMLEATSVIWEIGYAAEDLTEIKYIDGTTKPVEHAQVMDVVGTQEQDLLLAKQIEKIVVKKSSHQFKNLLLIDSPGLATITQQNAELTKSFLIEADLIVWVVNGNHLGQADVSEEIVEVAHLGKPIIAVINKIDEIDSGSENIEELVEYLDATSGDYLQKIFPLSAFQVLSKHNFSKKDDKSNESGLSYNQLFNDFIQYLQRQVDAKAKDVKQISTQDSCTALARRELIAHQSIKRQVQALIESYDEYRDDLRRDKAKIQKSIQLDIEKKYIALLKDKQFESEFKAIILQNPNITEKDILPILNKYNDPIRQHAKDNYNKAVSQAFDINSSQIINRFRKLQIVESEKMRVDLASYGLSYNYDAPEIKDSAIKGGAVLGAGGVALAGYAALLGANASAITLGAALSAVAFPLVAVGAAVGATYGFFKLKDKRGEHVSRQVHTLVTQLINISQEELLGNINHGLDINFSEMEDFYINDICSGKSLSEQKKLLKDLNTYIEGLYVFLEQKT